MPFELTDAEFAPFEHFPVKDIVSLAIALDIPVPETIDRRQVMTRCAVAMVEKGQRDGLPFSKYDRDDLEELTAEGRGAIAVLQGLPANASVSAILKAGQRVYKTYTNDGSNPIPLMLPMLLTAVARAAAQGVTQ